MSDLKPCPFCGGEAEIESVEWLEPEVNLHGAKCKRCGAESAVGETKAEAVAAWNTRAPIEYEGWFYLPKPKKGIVQYGASYVEEVENGYKLKQPVEVIESAIRSWGDELGDYVMKRICEAWNSRAERTCKSTTDDNAWCFACSECGKSFPRSQLHLAHNHGEINYCPNCGAKVVGE